MEEKYKRVNILIRPDQYNKLVKSGLSLSGLIRELLDKHFNDNLITLSLGKRSKRLYENIVSNFGAGDEQLEKFFVEALDRFLEIRSKEIDVLRIQLQEVKEEEI